MPLALSQASAQTAALLKSIIALTKRIIVILNLLIFQDLSKILVERPVEPAVVRKYTT